MKKQVHFLFLLSVGIGVTVFNGLGMAATGEDRTDVARRLQRHVRFNERNNEIFNYSSENSETDDLEDTTSFASHADSASGGQGGSGEVRKDIVLPVAGEVAHRPTKSGAFERIHKEWKDREREAMKTAPIKAPLPVQTCRLSTSNGTEEERDSSVQSKIREKIARLNTSIGGDVRLPLTERVHAVQKLVGCIEGGESINEGLQNFLNALNKGLQQANRSTYYDRARGGKEHITVIIPTTKPLKIRSLAELHDLFQHAWEVRDQKGKSQREKAGIAPHTIPGKVVEERERLEANLSAVTLQQKIQYLKRALGSLADEGVTIREQARWAQGLVGVIEEENSLFGSMSAFLRGINKQLERALSMGYFGGYLITGLHIDLPVGKPTPHIQTLAEFYNLFRQSKMNYQGKDR